MPDRKGNIKCPACGKEMTEIFMPEQGINIDVCLNGCGGIFFNNREFKHFDAKDQNIDTLLEAMKGKNFSQVHETTTTRTCPVCGAAMVKNYSSATKQIQVDDCYSCGGKFLDHGELIKIREEGDYNDAMQTVCSIAGLDFHDERRNQEAVKKLFDSLINKK